MDINAEITAIRAMAEELGTSRMAFQPCTTRQAGVIARAFEEVIGDDREERLAVLERIFPFGDRGPVHSTRDLSKAQASVLIQWLYGLDRTDKLTGDDEVAWQSGVVLSSIVGRIRQQQAILAGQTELYRAPGEVFIMDQAEMFELPLPPEAPL